MSDFRAKAQASFLATRQQSNLEKIEVPEWGTDLYFYPSMTGEENQAILKAGVTESGVHDYIAASVATVIYRARTSVGQPVFEPSEADDLMRKYDIKVVLRIAGQMMAKIDKPDESELQKN